MRRLAALLALLLLPTPARANACEDAGRLAEHAAGLPENLLLAVGRVESGRREPDGHTAPYPWAVNAAGEGHYFASGPEAIAFVQALQARGIRSIDVGCFQVNLQYHPDAFTSLEDAFDPASNARAAAAFLATLRDSLGIEQAVAHYHSADPARGGPYLQQVMASWHGGPLMARPPLSQVATLVRVIVPGSAMPAIRGLPIVITPLRRAL